MDRTVTDLQQQLTVMTYVADCRDRYLDDAIQTVQKIVRRIPSNQQSRHSKEMQHIEEICEQLIAHGMDPATPAALIVRGTLPNQEVIEAPVAELAQTVRSRDIFGPTTIVIGKVVGLRSDAVRGAG